MRSGGYLKDVYNGNWRKKWSSGNQQVARTSFSPIPSGDYKLKMKRVWETRKSDSPKSSQLRYVNGYFEVTIPGKDKPRRQYHSFHLDLTPSDKDGVAMPNRGGQLVELCKAINEQLSAGIVQQQKNKDGTFTKVDTLNPKQVAEFLNNLDGTELMAHIKVEKNYKNEDDNVIEYFIESEASDEEEEEVDEEESIDEDEDESDDSDEGDEEEADEDEVEDLDDAELEEEDEDEEEVDDLPPPKDTGKKVKQGPPSKSKPVAKKKSKK